MLVSLALASAGCVGNAGGNVPQPLQSLSVSVAVRNCDRMGSSSGNLTFKDSPNGVPVAYYDATVESPNSSPDWYPVALAPAESHDFASEPVFVQDFTSTVQLPMFTEQSANGPAWFEPEAYDPGKASFAYNPIVSDEPVITLDGSTPLTYSNHETDDGIAVDAYVDPNGARWYFTQPGYTNVSLTPEGVALTGTIGALWSVAPATAPVLDLANGRAEVTFDCGSP